MVTLRQAVGLVGGKMPVIVLANKFDVHRAQSAYQLCKAMKLPSLLASALKDKGSVRFSPKKNPVPLWCWCGSGASGGRVACIHPL